MSDSIFTKIINREISADIVFEDELAIAFHDISAKAPVHVLVVPKEPISSLQAAVESQRDLLGHLQWVIAQVAKKLEIDKSGYRVVTNIGSDGGQSVPHLHYHVLGGRKLDWPPG